MSKITDSFADFEVNNDLEGAILQEEGVDGQLSEEDDIEQVKYL